MILCRAPLRISFVGGGSDLPAFCENEMGAVVSMAIKKYVYVGINRKFDDAIRISYSKTEIVNNASELEHHIVRSCLETMGLHGGLEIVTIADIPSSGTGLGSSSSFTCALLHALHAYKNQYVGEKQLAEETCDIEINRCGQPIGRQDQYAAAYGGLNFFQFGKAGRVDVTPIICSNELVEQIEQNMLIFYTGKTRSASAILAEQGKNTASDESKAACLRKMVSLAHEMRNELQMGRLDNFGALLHENWLLKRGLAKSISDSDIDIWYKKARDAGAEGGKILGAGGGGFMLFYAPREKHAQIKAALPELRTMSVGMERSGSSIIFYHP